MVRSPDAKGLLVGHVVTRDIQPANGGTWCRME
jgi:hypothetical protein